MAQEGKTGRAPLQNYFAFLFHSSSNPEKSKPQKGGFKIHLFLKHT
jgi:hypothetical protein